MFFRKKILTESEFAYKYAEALKKEMPEIEIVSVNNLDVVTSLNSNPYSHFLDNAFSEYLRNPKELKITLERYIKKASTLYAPKQPLNTESIMPVIKDIRFLNGLDELPGDVRSKHVYEPYNSELYIFYAEDTEHSIRYLTHNELREANISLNEIKTRALENLNNHISIEKHGENGYFMLVADGTFEASILLLNIWTKESFPVDGDIVIGIPARDALFVTGSKNSDGLHKLYDAVTDITKTGDHLVSENLFEYKNGRFEVL